MSPPPTVAETYQLSFLLNMIILIHSSVVTKVLTNRNRELIISSIFSDFLSGCEDFREYLLCTVKVLRENLIKRLINITFVK